MDALYLSERILVSNDVGQSFVSGGVLVSFEDGRILKIFTSQQEINSWLFVEHGGEVRKVIFERVFPRQTHHIHRFTISERKC